MSAIEIGIAGMILLLFFFFLGVPVSFSFLLAGTISYSWLISPSAGLRLLSIQVFDTFSDYFLTVVPMFVLMGSLSFSSGIGGRLFDAGYSVFGRLRGGLAIGSVAACAGFAAVCGSTAATAAAMGKVALPEMKRYHYDDALSTGCIAAAGSLGILIPPSSTLIVYAMLTEQSVSKLFIGGILPGILLAFLFAMTIILLCLWKPHLAPAGPETTLKQKLSAIFGITEMLIVFLMVMGGLFTGWFTPTQAGGAGAAAVLIIALIRRTLTWKGLFVAVEETIRISCMVMLLISGALIFSRFLAATKIPFLIADWLVSLPFSPMTIMALIVLFHFVAGTFMDAFGLILLTVPILFPAVKALGIDPVWYGIVIILVVEMGVISPPEGINMWVVKGIAQDVSLGTIFKGVIPFMAALVVCAAILLVFPKIVTFLPNLMSY
jgi:C4-dicarboxylate transporter DctM subunit